MSHSSFERVWRATRGTVKHWKFYCKSKAKNISFSIPLHTFTGKCSLSASWFGDIIFSNFVCDIIFWSSRRFPCPWVILKVPSNTNHSMILKYFYKMEHFECLIWKITWNSPNCCNDLANWLKCFGMLRETHLFQAIECLSVWQESQLTFASFEQGRKKRQDLSWS